MDGKEIVLEPCPFCGSAMRIFSGDKYFAPACVDQGCIAGEFSAMYVTREEAIKVCNERSGR